MRVRNHGARSARTASSSRVAGTLCHVADDDALSEHRRVVRDVVDEVRRLPVVDDHATGDELRRRRAVLRRLRTAFVAHATAAERHVWRAARRRFLHESSAIDEALQRKVSAEHNMVKLQWLGDRDELRNPHVAELVDCIERYLTSEQRIAARLHDAMTLSERDAFARDVAHELRWAPTRPHPDLPSTPWLSVVLAPVVALVDRARDLLDPLETGP